MGAIEDRIIALGIALPAPIALPPGTKIQLEFVRISGAYAYVSGHTPFDGDKPLMEGKVESVEQGYEAARLTALTILASLQRTLGDLNRVAGWVKALGFVNAAPGFTALPPVINGFSDLIVEIWGDAGRHARSAIGVAELPFGAPVEVEAIVELA
jgi:enamine deaminase RidA (YjgF/YER057c/UK114 family)